jgi:hypothetical protein
VRELRLIASHAGKSFAGNRRPALINRWPQIRDCPLERAFHGYFVQDFHPLIAG